MNSVRCCKLTLLIFFGFFFSSLQAQQKPEILSGRKTSDGRYTFLKFKPATKGQKRNDTSAIRLKSILDLSNRNSLSPIAQSKINSAKEAPEKKHTRHQQFFNGIRVEHAIITAHSNNGNLELITGEYYEIPDNFSITASITESTAFERAIQFVGALRYSWDDKNFLEKKLSTKPKGELLICQDFNNGISTRNSAPLLRLAYKFEIYATQPLRHEYVYIDANTGKILLSDPIIKHIEGPADTRYSGSRTLSTTQKTNGNHTLKDTSGDYNIATWNLNKTTSYISATEFLDNDNNWTAAEYNNSNFDNAALDAHWGAMKTFEYFKTRHNRNSFDNSGARINSYVHYATGYVNAFWNGYNMTYGDGNGTGSFPLTAVDIVGHEIGHAVCQYSAGLIYGYESGALNESLSDIWGACIERFAAPEKNTWLLGDEILLSVYPFRSMSNPKSHGQPDTYLGINWYTGTGDNGGVHINSGVMNHWFYILTDGKSGVNDNGRAYNVTAIGIDKAAEIVYRAETMYLFPNAGYIDARLATIQAAEDLFQINSNEYNQVKEAWDAVGVNDKLPPPRNLSGVVNSNKIQLNWVYSSYIPLQHFVLERAINGNTEFVQIASPPAGSRSYIDSAYSPDSFNKYRIRAVQDTLVSEYSSIISVPIGNSPVPMIYGTYNICGRVFLDPGGFENYRNNQTVTMTLAASPGTKVRITFNKFKTHSNSDYLNVYDGPTMGYPLIGQFSLDSIPPFIESTAYTGELTLFFQSNDSDTQSGWEATVSCNKPLNPPSALSSGLTTDKKATLYWIDTSPDETAFVIERSNSDAFNLVNCDTVASNKTSYLDWATPDSGLIYYRVKAIRDTFSSNYSNTAYVLIRSDSVDVCPAPAGSAEYITIKSNVYGTSYQWQKHNGAAFVNLLYDANHSGTQTSSLQVKYESLKNGDKFRCIVNSTPERTFTINKYQRWSGANGTNWNDPQNWSCGTVPGAEADIVIESGKLNYPLINANVSCRSLTVMSGASVQVLTGFNVTITK